MIISKNKSAGLTLGHLALLPHILVTQSKAPKERKRPGAEESTGLPQMVPGQGCLRGLHIVHSQSPQSES